jgi:ATP-binding cassette subfamily F protein uup
MEFVNDRVRSSSSSSDVMAETPDEARRLLRQFEFPKTRWNERVSVLSGGERRRLQLLSVLSMVRTRKRSPQSKRSVHTCGCDK